MANPFVPGDLPGSADMEEYMRSKLLVDGDKPRQSALRLYSFVNALYLKEIQYGIQTAHLVSRMFTRQPPIPKGVNPSSLKFSREFPNSATALLTKWAADHETIVVLNGGNCAALEQLYREQLFPLHLAYPVMIFNEDIESLNGATTATGIVLPAEVYDAEPYVTDVVNVNIYPGPSAYVYRRSLDGYHDIWYYPGSLEWNLLSVLKTYKLA